MMLCATPSTLLAFGMPGGAEWIVLLVIGLLIFGRRLPEVGRSLGRGIVEFKRGVKGIDDEITDASSQSTSKQIDHSATSEMPSSTEKSQPANESATGEKTD
jgi:sec-independent protein translocase protein TatA